MSKLKLPKNLREFRPKCCVSCKHYISKRDNTHIGWMECERDSEAVSSDVTDYGRICDYYKGI